MTHGFETYRPDTSVIMDGASKAGVFLEVLVIPANSMSGSKSYSSSVAGSLYCLNVDAGSHDFIVDVDGAGNDRVSWTRRSANPAQTSLFVLTRKVATPAGYGMLIANDAGQTLADFNYPVPQYAGSVQPAAAAAATYLCAGGNRGNTHQAPSANLRSGTNRVVLVRLPDSGTDDIWYSCDSIIPASNTTGSALAVNVFAPAGVSYQVPTLHVYSLDGPIGASSGEGIQLFSPSLALVYDSSAENVSVKDSVVVNYPAAGATVTYTLDLPANAGVLIPYFYRVDRSSSGTDKYLSAVKRVGNQLTFKTMYISHTPADPVMLESYQLGASSNSYCVAVDLSQLGGTSIAGVPATVVQSVPVINTQPASQTITAGNSVTFTIAASGNPAPTYQWYVGGAPISGAMSSSYTFTTASGDNGKVYLCIVSNTFNGSTNNVTSSSATLTIGASGTAPSITTQPTSQSVPIGQAVTFSVNASGTAPLSYAWYKSGSGTVRSTSATYTFTTVAGDDGGYYCVISNAYGSLTSSSATLTLTAAQVGISITSQPANQTVLVGGSASFSCSASGSAPITYQWYKADGSYMGGSSTLTISPAAATDASGYYCKVSNAVNFVNTSTATLTVNNPPNVPTITSQPSPLTRGTNASATFSCSATGGTLTYAWYLVGSGTVLGTSSSVTVTTTGATAGNYYCRVSNSAGYTDTNTALLTLTDTTPVISVQPASVSTPQGTAVTLTCTASPATQYSWRTYSSGTILATGSSYSPPVGTVGSESYVCIVENYSSSIISSQATVTVTGSSASTFSTYANWTGTLEDYDSPAYYTIASDGTTDLGRWGNPAGGGDGNLYSHTASVASGIYSPAAGGGAIGTAYTGTATYNERPPTSTTSGASRSCTLTITTRLISSGAIVCTQTVTLISTNS